MSSPFPAPNYAYPDRAAASSPSQVSKGRESSQQPEDVTIRQMRLKVLYTFDDQNKTNCLARWPHVLDIRTAYLDESTQIGVIELKTCIQAIVSASPELVVKLGQDYTVYAYDYSEYETPLVGQGMLSWVLASSSSTPSAPAHQSRTVVTGRVCKNIMGLFSSSTQETLEVKLRLVPVPTSLQSEYIESMRKYRDLSRVMPGDFDAGAWTSFLQANPGILQLAEQNESQSPQNGQLQNEGFGIEHIQRLVNGGPAPRHSGESRGFQVSGPGNQHVRTTSPSSGGRSVTAPQPQREGLSRASSRTSIRDVQQQRFVRQESVDTGFASTDDRSDEWPAKKRAKVIKVDWPGKANFGTQPESLRVAASTAASVRVHQPTAIRPSGSAAKSLEIHPRAPTPIANPTNQMKKPLLPAVGSLLRSESFVASSDTYQSPYMMSEEISKPPESTMTSPDASRAASSSLTPADIASSPPVLPDISTAPSSPLLPMLPRDMDSGFMSGSFDDLFEDDENRPLDEEDFDIAAQYSKRGDLTTAAEDIGEVGKIHDMGSANEQYDQIRSNALSNPKPLAKGSSRSRVLDRTTSSGGLASSSITASDPIRPSVSGLQRSMTWSGHQMPHAVSDAPTEPGKSKITKRPYSRRGSGSGVRRKKAIEKKLVRSVAAGEVPPFCDNCGAIETPTWRKAWVKTHSGTPEHVRISDEEGGIIAWQAMENDETGNVSLYKIFKRSLLEGDVGFSEISLCNPCGLSLHKRKCVRPKEVWEKTQKGPDEKRRRAPRSKTKPVDSTGEQPTTDASQGMGIQSDASSPANGAIQESNVEEASQLKPLQCRRASSVQMGSRSAHMNEVDAALALQRAIQSSPARFLGTQIIPIEVDDLTPKPTRRVLFPSPPQNNDTDRLQCPDSDAAQIQARSPGNSEYGLQVDGDQANKENCPPPAEEDQLGHLFEEASHPITCPTTPTPTSKDNNNPFKTPTASATPTRPPPTTGDFFSSAAKALFRPIVTPKRTPTKSSSQPLAEMTPFTAHLNRLLSEATNTSPSAGNFDFPSLPSLDNTPGRVRHEFDFTQFDSQDLLSTDVPMPSSPPVWFGVYEDPAEQGSGLWSEYQFPDSPGLSFDEKSTPGLVIDERGHARVGFDGDG